MKISERRPKRSVNLSESLRHRLDTYALAASAAGVSLLVLAQPADARIIYTPTHHVIGYPGSYNLDLNNDGIADVKIFETNHSTSEGGQITRLIAAAGASNLVKGYPLWNSVGSRLPYASALRPGQKIGGSQTRFGYGSPAPMAGAATVAGGPAYSFGAWGNLPLIPYRYLGVKFEINGTTHYGWARMIVKVSGVRITATLTGYAYETVPNKTIVAGKKSDSENGAELFETPDPADAALEPASLGRLAQGATGMVARHRKNAAPGTESTK
jgi:hypothetical protein